MELSELSVRAFAELLGSDAPAPGGGSAAALSGALGASLTAMVSSLTLGRKKYEAEQDFAAETFAKATDLQKRFLTAMERDNAVFTRFSKTMAMPKDTEEEKAARTAAMQAALSDCTRAPLTMMALSCEALELTKSAIGRTNKGAASDLGVAALALKAAVQSAWLNVLINIHSLKGEGLAEQFREDGEKYLAKALPLADAIYAEIEASL